MAISRALLLIANHPAAFKPSFTKPLQSLQPLALFFILYSAAAFLPLLLLFWLARCLIIAKDLLSSGCGVGLLGPFVLLCYLFGLLFCMSLAEFMGGIDWDALCHVG
ncbi:hypothetical protein U1Q18_010589, partial [Sarracenia purpurea var. burkii]